MTSLHSRLNAARVRAPEFPTGTWINSDALTLKSLRGRIVLLDFWTFCCGNCLHVIDELRTLEREFPDELVIVGVHSPKFEHERSDESVRAATERYGVAHPVLNDPELYLWRQYAVRAWPTLVLVDPHGYVVAQAAGEGQVSALRAMITELIAAHDADGSLVRGDNPYRPPVTEPGVLRFPASAVTYGDLIAVADAGHHQLVLTEADGATVRARFGSGQRSATGLADPNGVATLPADVAAAIGYDLVVADTGNHMLRLVDGDSLLAGDTRTDTVDLPAALAGTSTITGAVPSVLSPWAVAWWPALREVVIAAAGVHLLLGWNPLTGTVRILAGTTVEGLKDGPALDGWLAQPSGLAVDGDRVWFTDSETSALRYLTAEGELHTAIGEGLFDFGLVDGGADSARMQHPLGVALLDDGSLAIADTYNGAVRRYDPATGLLSTLATDLVEPSGVLPVDDTILVVESGAHRLIRPITAGQLGEARRVSQAAMRTERPVTDVRAGGLTLSVAFTPPPGRKLDDRYGPSTRLSVSASPESLLAVGSGDGPELTRHLVLTGEPGTEAVLQVVAQAASCDDDPATEKPACYLARQDWGIPIRITADGAAELELPLLG